MTRTQINECKKLGLLTDSDIPSCFEDWTPAQVEKSDKALKALAAHESNASTSRFEIERLAYLKRRFSLTGLEVVGLKVPEEVYQEKPKPRETVSEIERQHDLRMREKYKLRNGLELEEAQPKEALAAFGLRDKLTGLDVVVTL
jgi:hypothetical protein